MKHLKTGLYTEIRYVCIKNSLSFKINNKYIFYKYTDEKFYREKESFLLFSAEFIKNIFILDKEYYRELNLKLLLNE